MRRIICKIFKHKWFTEVFAKEVPTKTRTPRYTVTEQRVCGCCNKVETLKVTGPMSRTELLRQEWFITNGLDYYDYR